MASKFLRPPYWWIKFRHPTSGTLVRESLETTDEARAELAEQSDLFRESDALASSSPLHPMDACERLQADFDGQNLTTGRHAMALVRQHLPSSVWRAVDLAHARNRQWIRIAGNVICRQRPGTAKGIVFISLEDETGIADVIVAAELFERRRLTLSQEAFLLIEGWVQIAEGTIHIKAERIEGLSNQGAPHADSHDFR